MPARRPSPTSRIADDDAPAMTQAGMILGTAAYMSAGAGEGQGRGPTAHDIWAFGCVLYEMLTGRRAFEGETVARLWRRCSRPNRTGAVAGRNTWRHPAFAAPLPAEGHERRHRDIVDARLEIDEARTRATQTDHPVPSASRRRERVVLICDLGARHADCCRRDRVAFRPLPPAPEMRLEINTPPTTDPVSLAISPDGQNIVFAADSEGRPRLWLRELDSGASRPLTGTEGARIPFWSPDSRSVGFFADGKLKRIDIEGGSVQTLANASSGTGGAWNRDSVILFTMLGNPIFRVSDTGGEPVAVTQVESQQGSHFLHNFCPMVVTSSIGCEAVPT